MQSNSFNVSDLSKEEKREIWLRRAGITQRILAEVAGVTCSTLSAMLKRPTMPTARHAALIAFGVPADLLPEPLDRKSGAKPRTLADIQMGNAATQGV